MHPALAREQVHVSGWQLAGPTRAHTCPHVPTRAHTCPHVPEPVTQGHQQRCHSPAAAVRCIMSAWRCAAMRRTAESGLSITDFDPPAAAAAPGGDSCMLSSSAAAMSAAAAAAGTSAFSCSSQTSPSSSCSLSGLPAAGCRVYAARHASPTSLTPTHRLRSSRLQQRGTGRARELESMRGRLRQSPANLQCTARRQWQIGCWGNGTHASQACARQPEQAGT